MSGPSLNFLHDVFHSTVDVEAKLVDDAQRMLNELASDITQKTHVAVTARVKVDKRGQSIIEELLLGSVTRHVLAGATCDVLVVHERFLAPGA